MGKCDVCGKETETFVASSSCGATSYAYCKECIKHSREPYSALVGMGLPFDEIRDDFKKYILLPSLEFYGKTIEDFDHDVMLLDEKYFKWAQSCT